MKLSAWIVFAIAAVGLSASGTARAAIGTVSFDDAAPQDVSYSIWTVDGSVVQLKFMLPENAARNLGAPGKPLPTAVGAALAVSARTAARSSGGDCPAMVQDQGAGRIDTLALTPGMYRYQIIFECPTSDGIILHDGVLFDRVPGHVNYARVQRSADRPALGMFTRDHQDLALPAAGSRLAGVGVADFARRGAGRLFGHPETMVLILGMLLLTSRWSDLIEIAGVLTLGYLASLGVALSGRLAIDSGLSEAMVGMLLVLIGFCAMRRQQVGMPDPRASWIVMGLGAGLSAAGVLAAAFAGVSIGLTTGGFALFSAALVWLAGAPFRVRGLIFLPASLVGLLDGAGWSTDLARLRMPPLRMVPAFIGFDLGAIGAAVALAGVGMAVIWVLGRRLMAARFVALDVTAAAMIGLGVYVFVNRIHS